MQEYEINAPIHNVWDALTNPTTIEAWGAGFADMKDTVGYEFKLWGGDIHGKNLEVISEKVLKQEWYGGNWEKPSIVTFELEEKNKKTTLKLTQTDVPEKAIKDIEDGWKEYYLGPLKDLLEKS